MGRSSERRKVIFLRRLLRQSIGIQNFGFIASLPMERLPLHMYSFRVFPHHVRSIPYSGLLRTLALILYVHVQAQPFR